MLRALLLAALLPLPALARDDHGEAKHLAEAEGLRVLHAWTNAGAGDTAEVYMEIENAGDAPFTLASAHAEGVEMATIVAPPVNATGVVPETLDGLLLRPGVEMALEPNGLHVLLTGVEAPRKEGDEIDLTLVFEPQGEVEVHVQVEAEDATQHSHAGHSH